MSTAKEIIKYSIKFDSKIKKICSPLKDHLHIPFFTYYKIDKNGKLIAISNFTEQFDFYYQGGLYLTNPYFVDPSLIKSGCVFTAATPDSVYQKSIELSRKQFNLTNTFLIVQQKEDSCEGYHFGNNETNTQNKTDYFENIFLLKKFINYFKNEASPILNKINSEEGINLIKEKGSSFFERSLSLPLSNRISTDNFLKAIDPLSKREQECINLFLQGHSAQSTAAIIGLSKRTVEHYFENIMQKLGCRSKSELHQRYYFE